MVLAIYRIMEAADGSITIDGHNAADLSLSRLRSSLSIIPQDPVIFSGTLRQNLDPFNEFGEDQIWRALELSHLKEFTSKLEGGLDFVLTEYGNNVSVGQKQLVCLARALLRKSKVLIMDEATANVDLYTDDLIQKTIGREFKECTVITIAHRLSTIMDHDMVLVLQNGEIQEFDSPKRLMDDRGSIFFSLAVDAGIVSAK